MVYRCDFEKVNPMSNEHWFFRTFEHAIEKFQTLLLDIVLPLYNSPSEYDLFPIPKDKLIPGANYLLFQSDDEMIWLEAIHFSDDSKT